MTRIHAALMFVAAVAGLTAAATGSGSPAEAYRLAADISAERDHISAPQLADRIMSGDAGLRVFDLRSIAEFEEMHIPTAQHASIETLMRARLPEGTTVVLYSEGGAHAAQGWLLLRLQGYHRVFVLREGIYEWIARVIEPRLAVDASPAEREEFEAAAARSRFFGGLPRAGVPRSAMPAGYWAAPGLLAVDPGVGQSRTTDSRQAIAGVRRRGC